MRILQEKKDRQFIEERRVDTSKLFLSDYHTDKLLAGLQLFYVDFEGYLVPEETCEYWFGCLCLGTAQMFLDSQLIVDNKTRQVKRDVFFLGMVAREELASVFIWRRVKKYRLTVEYGTRLTSNLITEYQEVGGVFFGFEAASPEQETLDKAVNLAKNLQRDSCGENHTDCSLLAHIDC